MSSDRGEHDVVESNLVLICNFRFTRRDKKGTVILRRRSLQGARQSHISDVSYELLNSASNSFGSRTIGITEGLMSFWSRAAVQVAVTESGTLPVPEKEGGEERAKRRRTQRTGRGAGSASPECIIGLIVGF